MRQSYVAFLNPFLPNYSRGSMLRALTLFTRGCEQACVPSGRILSLTCRLRAGGRKLSCGSVSESRNGSVGTLRAKLYLPMVE
jgi:hypothetical protein